MLDFFEGQLMISNEKCKEQRDLASTPAPGIY